MLDADFVDLLGRCDLLQVVFVTDIRIQSDLYLIVIHLLSYWSMRGPIIVYGRPIEFAYKFHVIAIVQLAKVTVFDGVGFITAE